VVPDCERRALHGLHADDHVASVFLLDADGLEGDREGAIFQTLAPRRHAAPRPAPLRGHGQEDQQRFPVLGVDFEFFGLVVGDIDPFLRLADVDAEGGKVIDGGSAVIPAATRPERGGIF